MTNRQVEDFEILVRYGALRGTFVVNEFLEPFRAMRPSLHRYCHNEAVVDIDFEGLEVGPIHTGGPMLTVLGTILQNDDMLSRYRDEWNVLGLEMEGIPYARAVHQCLKLGLLRDNLRVAVGYFASDAPLVPGESLAREQAFQALYATYSVTLAILRSQFCRAPNPPSRPEN